MNSNKGNFILGYLFGAALIFVGAVLSIQNTKEKFKKYSSAEEEKNKKEDRKKNDSTNGDDLPF